MNTNFYGCFNVFLALLFSCNFSIGDEKTHELLWKEEVKYSKIVEVAEANYRLGIADLIKETDEIELFLLNFEMLPLTTNHYGWESDLEPNKFPVIPYEMRAQVIKSMILSEAQKKPFVKTLKSTIALKKNSGGAFCHYPIHGVRITRNDDIIFQSSFCWMCDNFYFQYPQNHNGWVGISNNELETVFSELLPIPEEETKRFEKYLNLLKNKNN